MRKERPGKDEWDGKGIGGGGDYRGKGEERKRGKDEEINNIMDKWERKEREE